MSFRGSIGPQAFTGQPTQGTVQSSVVVGNAPSWLELAGKVLYVAVASDSAIKAISVSSPAAPTVLGTVTVGTNTGWLKAKGKYLYAADVNGAVLRVINVTNPAAMTVAASLTFDANGNGASARFDIQRSGYLLLVGGPESGATDNNCYVIDVSNPLVPVVMNAAGLNVGGTHRGIAAIEETHFALASRDDATVYIIDVTIPSAPVVVASAVTTQSNTTAAVLYRRPYLYVGNYGNGTTLGGFEIWDLSLPYSPIQCGVLAVAGGIEQMSLRGRYCFCSQRNNLNFLIIDVSNPALPILALTGPAVGTFRTQAIAAGDGYVWVTNTVASGSQVGTVQSVSINDNYLARLSAVEALL